jgi:hypothetical protein
MRGIRTSDEGGRDDRSQRAGWPRVRRWGCEAFGREGYLTLKRARFRRQPGRPDLP